MLAPASCSLVASVVDDIDCSVLVAERKRGRTAVDRLRGLVGL